MANNPVVVACPANAWVKVATNVTIGTLYRLSALPSGYIQTIRITGDPAPLNNDDAANIFKDSEQSQISSDSGIDVYIKAINFAGEVRVDL